jgi:hypothetical protein
MTRHCDQTRPASRFGERLGLLTYGYSFSNMRYHGDTVRTMPAVGRCNLHNPLSGLYK